MAKYTVGPSGVGAHDKTLTANVVDTITFARNLSTVEIVSDGAAAIYGTVDGSDPTVGGEESFYMPEGPASIRVVKSPRNQQTVIKLISPGTPTYSVARIV